MLFVTLQTQKGSKHEKYNTKVPVDFFFFFSFDNSIQIIHIKYQHQEFS